MDLRAAATKHLGDTIAFAIKLAPTEGALVVYDRQSPLANVLTDAYQAALPRGRFLEFETAGLDGVRGAFNECKPGDLVVLVQSTNFRLDEFRIRIELFKRGLKTIEHTHLDRIRPEEEEIYVDALAYPTEYYHRVGHALKERLDRSTSSRVRCTDTELVYASAMEPTKLNIGDYTGMKNVGGTFPIGEVFTEPKELTAVNGSVKVFAFAGTDHMVRIVEPFEMKVENGLVTSWTGAPAEFDEIMKLIQTDEPLLVREFGLGLNQAMTRTRIVSDITAYERMTGVHMSLGAKHAIYAKPGLKRRDGRYHIDVFVDVQEVQIDEEIVFKNGAYLV